MSATWSSSGRVSPASRPPGACACAPPAPRRSCSRRARASGGAYTYTPMGAEDARAELARPLEDALFFAGEATNADGHAATVHGAIETGYRAAGQLGDALIQ